MAKEDCMDYCINHTDWIPSLITILEKFYFIDVRAQRTEMIEYVQQGQASTPLLGLEIHIIKLLKKYLKNVDHTNKDVT